MRNSIWLAVTCIMALAGSACTFVKPSAQGVGVRIVQASDVGGCKKIGRTTVTVPYKLGFIPRSDKSVDSDLNAMGKNSAADMKGDTIVSVGQPKQGNETFEVYRCRQ